MTSAQKAAFAAKMAAARAAKSKPTPTVAPTTQGTSWGKCPNCGKIEPGMTHSC